MTVTFDIQPDQDFQPIQAVFFDLDGTLVDTAPDFLRTINLLCQKHGYPKPSAEALHDQVSAGVRAMMLLMFGEKSAQIADDDPQLLALRQEFLDIYEANICVDSRVFAGLDRLLDRFDEKGILWGVVTNKPRYLSELLLEKLGLSQRCAVLVCPDDVANTKPDPEPLFLACKVTQTNPQYCVYVGDHLRDIEAGQQAGMLTVLAGFGYIVPEEKDQLPTWEANKIVQTPEALVNFIEALL